VFATTGPSPAFKVCTWVSVTLNGAVTVILGAVVSVDPVTATLPVVPETVHSGAPAFCGAAVGQVLAAGVGAVVEVASLATEEVLVDEVDGEVVLDPQAASIRTNDPAQAAMAATEDMREEFTVAHATRHQSPQAGRPLT
jgi:hypothetical protein